MMFGLPDWIGSVGLTGVGALILYFTQAFVAWRKHAREENSAAESTGLEIKKHRDGLTLDLLREARVELKAARAEINELRDELEQHIDELARLRQVEHRLALYEEAIAHIEALLTAKLEGGREAAEHAARQFLARHEALKQVRGNKAQKEQVERAARKIGKKLTDGSDGK